MGVAALSAVAGQHKAHFRHRGLYVHHGEAAIGHLNAAHCRKGHLRAEWLLAGHVHRLKSPRRRADGQELRWLLCALPREEARDGYSLERLAEAATGRERLRATIGRYTIDTYDNSAHDDVSSHRGGLCDPRQGSRGLRTGFSRRGATSAHSFVGWQRGCVAVGTRGQEESAAQAETLNPNKARARRWNGRPHGQHLHERH